MNNSQTKRRKMEVSDLWRTFESIQTYLLAFFFEDECCEVGAKRADEPSKSGEQ